MVGFSPILKFPSINVFAERNTAVLKLYSLQALRGIAALAIVTYHAFSLSPSLSVEVGAAGVQLFFIISGVVMALTIRPDTKPLPFLYKRIVRVVPLYWIATLAIVLYLYLINGRVVSAEHILTSLFFLQPHPTSIEFPILYPGWSLNFEMFFYLLLFGALFFRGCTLAIAALTLVIFASVSGKIQIPYMNYYFSDKHLLVFAVGLAIGVIFKAGVRADKTVGAMMITASAVLFYVHRHVPGNILVGWGIPSALLVIGAVSFDTATLVRSKLVQFIGDASYSIYLSHPFVIWTMEWALQGRKSNVVAVLAIPLSVGIGSLVYLAIERPLLRALAPRAISVIRKGSVRLDENKGVCI